MYCELWTATQSSFTIICYNGYVTMTALPRPYTRQTRTISKTYDDGVTVTNYHNHVDVLAFCLSLALSFCIVASCNLIIMI